MINEGAKILDEGMAQRASDIDIVWINGYSWPVYRSGPMFYADLIGPDKVLAKMIEFEATMGEDSSRRRCWRRWSRKGSAFRICDGADHPPPARAIMDLARMRAWRRCSGLVGSKGSSVTVKSNPPSGTRSVRISAGSGKPTARADDR